MIYLDNSATTRPCPEAVAAVTEAMTENWGNPSALYSFGIDTARLLRTARQQVAKAMGAEPDRVFFTSGGTEADNWAIFGTVKRMGKRGRHIVTTAIEHHAVLNCMKSLEAQGYTVTYLQPDKNGCITPEQLTAILGDLTVDKAVTAQINHDAVVKAPGMKYRHYAPQSQVLIVSGSREKAAKYIHAHFVPGDRVLCFEEELPLYKNCDPLSYGQESHVETLSAGLFAALRELDDPTVHQVYARCPVGGGIAYAVQNRLKKAAAFHVVDAEEDL